MEYPLIFHFYIPGCLFIVKKNAASSPGEIAIKKAGTLFEHSLHNSPIGELKFTYTGIHVNEKQ